VPLLQRVPVRKPGKDIASHAPLRKTSKEGRNAGTRHDPVALLQKTSKESRNAGMQEGKKRSSFLVFFLPSWVP
jgi:hypothetical protein